MIRLLISARASFIANKNGATPLFVAVQNGHDRVIVTLARSRASINDHSNDGWTPIAVAAQKKHENVVRLLAHLGARLIRPDGYAFWLWQGHDTPARVSGFWLRIIRAGGDEPTEESRRLRRRMMVQAKMHDPRDGGPDEEPLE